MSNVKPTEFPNLVPVYQIIKDEDELRNFIEFLPELKDGETFYCCLFARKKYYSPLKADKSQLKRFTSNKARLFHKIKQLECAVGAYTQGEGESEIVIPQEALALYISPNPRSYNRAANASLSMLAGIITGNGKKAYNLHQEVMSEIQKAKGTSHFVDFDFDDANYLDIKEKVNEILNPESFHIVVTRGGFHLMIEPSKVKAKNGIKNWFLEIKKIHKSESSDTENHGDNMIPVPGCTQGGFTPYILK